MKPPTTQQAGAARPDDAAPGLARKSFAIELKELRDDGSFVMYALVFGNVDRGGDVIEPGAVVNLDEFVRDGFIALNHRASDLPVGYPTAAVQDARGLRVEGKFHSHPEAQQCRAVAKERLDAGKSVQASIGYLVVDAATEQRDGESVRSLKKIKVYESSFVNIAMNPQAGIVSAKSGAASAASLNRAGEAYARRLIRAGKIDDGKWAFAADDAHGLLGDDGDDWATYGKCHLAVDPDVADDEEGRWKYPFARKNDDGEIRVFADALRAIDSRAAQQGKTDISDAAKRLLAEVDKKQKGKSMSVEQKGLLVALKELLGLAGKAAESGKMSKAGMTRLKAFAEEIHEHGERTREHAKEMADHGKAAQVCAKEMKTFIKAYDPDADGDDDSGAGAGDEDDDATPRKPRGKKTEEPEDTDDASPPKGLSREQIAHKLASLQRPA